MRDGLQNICFQNQPTLPLRNLMVSPPQCGTYLYVPQASTSLNELDWIIKSALLYYIYRFLSTFFVILTALKEFWTLPHQSSITVVRVISEETEYKALFIL